MTDGQPHQQAERDPGVDVAAEEAVDAGRVVEPQPHHAGAQHRVQGARDAWAPRADQHREGRQQPHQVVHPRHGADQTGGEAGQGEGRLPVPRGDRPPGPPRPPAEGGQHQHRPDRPALHAQPCQDALERLVGDVVEPAHPGRVPQGPRPVEARGVRRDQGRERGGGRRHGRGHRGRPPPARDQQQPDEERGRELDGRRQADADPGPAGPPGREQPGVGEHQGQQQQVDLAEAEGVAQRFEERERAGGEACSVPAVPPPPGPDAHPYRERQRRQVEQQGGHCRGAQPDQRHRQHDDGRERG